MALVVKDRVKETTTTTSTGTYTLAGAATGFQSFAVVGDGNATYYTVTDGTDWEVGVGTYTASGTTLSRDTILASSNSGSAVNWGAGSKDVFLTYPAERSVLVDNNSEIVPATSASLVGNTTTIQLRYSSTPGAVPTALSLSTGELVVNTADGKLYFKDSGGTVKVLSQADQIAPLTTKGDLLVNDGTSNVRLPVGTNTHVLTADSTQASGVKWAAAAGGASPITISNKTGAYTVVAGDLGTIINCTSGTFTVSLTAAATLGSGFNCWVWNTGTGVITINPDGTETVDGIDPTTEFKLTQGTGIRLLCTGTAWLTSDVRMSGSASIGVLGVQLGRNSSGDMAVATTGQGAMALGGSYASGMDSFAAAGLSTTGTYGAIGANSIAIGTIAKASGSDCIALGRNTVASDYYGIAIGASSSASNGFVTAGNVAIGQQAYANAIGAVAIGWRAFASIKGKFAFANNTWDNNPDGSVQTGLFVLRRATTDSTATRLTTDNSAPGADDQIILPNNSAYAFSGTVVARQQAAGGTASAAWKVEGLIRREANAASTVLVASTVTAIDNTPGWTLALSADTTNGGLAVTATGAAATNIRWVATIQTSELTYA